jgi:hypothetical protein
LSSTISATPPAPSSRRLLKKPPSSPWMA